MECNAADLGQNLIDLISPPHCTVCTKLLEERRSPPICAACSESLHLCSNPFCPSCGTPYAYQTAEDHPCEACLLSPPPFAAARSVEAYEGVLQDMIHRCKYGGDVSVGETLGEMMVDFPYRAFDFNDYAVVMPLPLHTKCLRERGFNQSLLLAKAIARRHKLKLDYLSLAEPYTHHPRSPSAGRNGNATSREHL